MEMMQLLNSRAPQQKGNGLLNKTEKLLLEKDSDFLQALSQFLSSETILNSSFPKDMLNQTRVDAPASTESATLNPCLVQDMLNNEKKLIFLTEDGEKWEAEEFYQFIADLPINTTSTLNKQNSHLGQADSILEEHSLNEGKSNLPEFKGNGLLHKIEIGGKNLTQEAVQSKSLEDNSLKLFEVNKGQNLIFEAEDQDSKIQFKSLDKVSPANITETSVIKKSIFALNEMQNKPPIRLEQNVNLPSIQGNEVIQVNKESVNNALRGPITASLLLEQEENLLTFQGKDIKQTKSENLSSSFLSKESNSHFSLTNGQLFEPDIEGENLKFPQEPVISPKELPEFLMKQIGNKVKFNKLTGSSELNLRLKPAELGKITLQLLAQDGQVSVKILTENVRAREMVEQNLGYLKQNLANQGIKCTSINVEVGTDTSFNQLMGQNHNPFNNPKNGTQSKLRSSNNRKKEIEIDGYSKAENINQEKRMLKGLELFA
ncbi:MAG: hypothetical protein JM58_04040 [Peptococcaceae bacterium BICA1-8]|nr:MAG: hypothetical protein JM58_04040 [Peptococcaceae bacterium BICA1-8]